MFRSAALYSLLVLLTACAVGKNTEVAQDNSQASSNPASVVVTFTIPPKTTGAWNTVNNPFIVQAGQTVRIVNGDTAGNPHSVQTDGVPCTSSATIAEGSYYDCGPIPNTYSATADPITDGATTNTNAKFIIVVE